MKKVNMTLVITVLVFLINSEAIAQKFIPAFNSFSHKKTSHITLENGKEVKGNVKDLDWKKGLIKEVKLKDLDGKKVKIKPEDIKYMYLPPSGFDKFSKSLSFLNDATQWGETDLDKDIIGKGYAYLEKSDVKIKKKTRTLMVQLVNPTFSNKIKVYHDPITGETAKLGVAGIKVAGGLPKTYFVKKAGEKVAYELKKKNYDEEFKMLFKDCPKLIKKYGDNPKWADLETHIFEYSMECE